MQIQCPCQTKYLQPIRVGLAVFQCFIRHNPWHMKGMEAGEQPMKRTSSDEKLLSPRMSDPGILSRRCAKPRSTLQTQGHYLEKPREWSGE